ncbi:MAG: GNAT family N-acetyltransferase [Patescibacteria group bacterium]|nr:GNAT family N-acetyltransferase [Patescibacteria group bacterium]
MNVTLRPATEEDVETYARIAKRVESPINLATTDPNEVREEFDQINVFMIVCDGISVGYISYEHREARYAYISELAVDPDYQGRGIGGQALSMLLDSLRSQGLNVFSLMTHPENPARRLYERHGFTVVRQIEDFWGSKTPRLEMFCEDPD